MISCFILSVNFFSDRIPSEASFSRFTQKISESNALEIVQEALPLQAIQEDFIQDDVVSIDATHFESRDRTTPFAKKSIKSREMDLENIAPQVVDQKHGKSFTIKEWPLNESMPI